MPVASYAPELLQLFRCAAQSDVIVTLVSEQAALALRFRLHNLRREMRKERHLLTTLANGVQISIRNNILTARPADQSYLKALHEAGIEIETADEPAGAHQPSAPVNFPGSGEAEIGEALSHFFGEEAMEARKEKE